MRVLRLTGLALLALATPLVAHASVHAAPEIDLSGATAAATLAIGAVLVITGRPGKKKQK